MPAPPPILIKTLTTTSARTTISWRRGTPNPFPVNDQGADSIYVLNTIVSLDEETGVQTVVVDSREIEKGSYSRFGTAKCPSNNRDICHEVGIAQFVSRFAGSAGGMSIIENSWTPLPTKIAKVYRPYSPSLSVQYFREPSIKDYFTGYSLDPKEYSCRCKIKYKTNPEVLNH